MKYPTSINGRISLQKALHKRSTDAKVEKLRAYDHITKHKDFIRLLSLEKPMTRKVIIEYLRPESTWQSLSLDLNINYSEGHRYFKEGMKRIEGLLT